MYVALDIGGTKIRIASSDSLTPIAVEQMTFFPNTNNFTKDFPKLLEEIRVIAKSNTIDGIGIGIAGQLAEDKKTLIEAPNFSTWNNQNIVDAVAKTFPCPVVMRNDAVAGALGEAVFREYKGENFVYLIWGTGVGGAQVIYQDNMPMAKQLAWSTYFPTWEKDCGGKSIMNQFNKPAESLSEEEWEIIEQRFAKHLGTFLEKVPAARIVCGGGVALNHSMHLYHAVEMVKTSSLPIIVVSSLGETANLMGAFYFLQHSPGE